jgi:hypothetical protein
LALAAYCGKPHEIHCRIRDLSDALSDPPAGMLPLEILVWMLVLSLCTLL